MAYARWTLVHLFLVTCIPFSTMVVGRYGNLAPAVCLYAANMLLAAVGPFGWVRTPSCATQPSKHPGAPT